MRTLHRLIVLAGLVASAMPAYGQQYSYGLVDASQLTDISNNGTIIGRYFFGYAWVIERHREPVSFANSWTPTVQVLGINNSETVVGSLQLNGVTHPFISNLTGTEWHTLPRVDGFATTVNAISNNGLVFANRAGGVGVVIDTRHGDAVTSVTYPGSVSTSLQGGNDNGFLFGTAATAAGTIRWKAKHGLFEPLILPPGVPSNTVIANDTNNRGDLILNWVTPDNVGHTGILRANGDLQELVFPGIADIMVAINPPSVNALGTTLYLVPGQFRMTGTGLNDLGDVVGNLAQIYAGTRADGTPVTLVRAVPACFLASRGAGGN